jgi:transcriptional regulator with XRE-family HTH domain
MHYNGIKVHNRKWNSQICFYNKVSLYFAYLKLIVLFSDLYQQMNTDLQNPNHVKRVRQANLAHLLEVWMATQNLSMHQLAVDIDCSYTAVRSWVRKESSPGNNMLLKLSNYYKINKNELDQYLDGYPISSAKKLPVQICPLVAPSDSNLISNGNISDGVSTAKVISLESVVEYLKDRSSEQVFFFLTTLIEDLSISSQDKIELAMKLLQECSKEFAQINEGF